MYIQINEPTSHNLIIFLGVTGCKETTRYRPWQIYFPCYGVSWFWNMASKRIDSGFHGKFSFPKSRDFFFNQIKEILMPPSIQTGGIWFFTCPCVCLSITLTLRRLANLVICDLHVCIQVHGLCYCRSELSKNFTFCPILICLPASLLSPLFKLFPQDPVCWFRIAYSVASKNLIFTPPPSYRSWCCLPWE